MRRPNARFAAEAKALKPSPRVGLDELGPMQGRRVAHPARERRLNAARWRPPNGGSSASAHFDVGVRGRTGTAERLRVSSPGTPPRENQIKAFEVGTAVLRHKSEARQPAHPADRSGRGGPAPASPLALPHPLGRTATRPPITPSSGTLQRQPRRPPRQAALGSSPRLWLGSSPRSGPAAP